MSGALCAQPERFASALPSQHARGRDGHHHPLECTTTSCAQNVLQAQALRHSVGLLGSGIFTGWHMASSRLLLHFKSSNASSMRRLVDLRTPYSPIPLIGPPCLNNLGTVMLLMSESHQCLHPIRSPTRWGGNAGLTSTSTQTPQGAVTCEQRKTGRRCA